MRLARLAAPLLVLALAACGAPDGSGEASPVSRSGGALEGDWRADETTGYGVARIDTGNPLGESVLLAYAGYGMSRAQAEAWAGALYDARLRSLGVRHLFAVQGPRDVGYAALEIGNSRIAAALRGLVGPRTGFILVAAHSSGAYVADELLRQLGDGADPVGELARRLVFFNLDGGERLVRASDVARLRRAFYAYAADASTGLESRNASTMRALGAAYASSGGALRHEAAGSGCETANCLHMTLVNTRPHARTGFSGADYTDFAGRPVNVGWVDARREESGLGACTTTLVAGEGIEAPYAALGGCGSALGTPTSSAARGPDGRLSQRFEHGTITVEEDGTASVAIDGADAGTPAGTDAGTTAGTDAGTFPEEPSGAAGDAPDEGGGCATTGAATALAMLGVTRRRWRP